MGFLFVGQLNRENILQARKQLGIGHRKNDFDAMTQVAPHEVGGRLSLHFDVLIHAKQVRRVVALLDLR